MGADPGPGVGTTLVGEEAGGAVAEGWRWGEGGKVGGAAVLLGGGVAALGLIPVGVPAAVLGDGVEVGLTPVPEARVAGGRVGD